jgi:3-deoxy-D-manno-octulosonic-acid transferase
MMTLYRFICLLLTPIWAIWIAYRLLKGKESWRRFGERLGYASASPCSEQPIIWLHGASVGESFIAMNLASELSALYPYHRFLITTGTITSAKLVCEALPDRCYHQFIPIDGYCSVKRFFHHWKPSLGIIVESEIWPNLLDIGSKCCPLILVNAIMSNQSYIKWQKFPRAAWYFLSKFSSILCQSEVDRDKYISFGVTKKVINLGNLKFSSPKPEIDERKFDALKKQISQRPVILAASTHKGDEEIICALHHKVSAIYPQLLTIIAPRHPHRADEILKIIKSHDLSCSLRSNQEPITLETEIYLADTLGELTLFFSLAKVTIMGGSFAHGGHNPIEPAHFDTTIIFGPDMSNFKYIAEEFLRCNAAIKAHNLDALTEKVLLSMTRRSTNTARVLEKNARIMDDYLAHIKRYLI